MKTILNPVVIAEKCFYCPWKNVETINSNIEWPLIVGYLFYKKLNPPSFAQRGVLENEHIIYHITMYFLIHFFTLRLHKKIAFG